MIKKVAFSVMALALTALLAPPRHCIYRQLRPFRLAGCLTGLQMPHGRI